MTTMPPPPPNHRWKTETTVYDNEPGVHIYLTLITDEGTNPLTYITNNADEAALVDAATRILRAHDKVQEIQALIQEDNFPRYSNMPWKFTPTEMVWDPVSGHLSIPDLPEHVCWINPADASTIAQQAEFMIKKIERAEELTNFVHNA